MNPTNKVAVVTGAASGLGLATARALASAGSHIAAFDVHKDRLAALGDELGDACLTLAVDVTDEQAVAAALDGAVDRFGSIDIAVNCAGIEGAAKTVSKGKPFPLDLWNRVIAVNLTGSFNIIRLAAVHMANNAPEEPGAERGVIISTASGAATQGQVGQAAYSASKAALIGLTLPVARDLAPLGIRIMTISPGVFATPMLLELPEKVVDSLVQNTILFPNRMGDPAEFGSLVRQIVENAYFNAATIDLDGGARMTAR